MTLSWEGTYKLGGLTSYSKGGPYKLEYTVVLFWLAVSTLCISLLPSQPSFPFPSPAVCGPNKNPIINGEIP